jgi:hypothetical protein
MSKHPANPSLVPAAVRRDILQRPFRVHRTPSGTPTALPAIVRGVGTVFRVPLIAGLLLGCGPTPSALQRPAAAPPTAQGRACSGDGPGSADEAPALELHLRPLPNDTNGALAVRVVMTAPEAELPSFRPPVALRQPLQVRLKLERAGCASSSGEVPPRTRVLEARPGAPLSLGADAASRERVRMALEYQLDGLDPRTLNATRFLAAGKQVFFLPVREGEEATKTLVSIDASRFGPDGLAASSIGLGA